MRYGALLDEDWSDGDPDEFLRDRCNEVPFLPHAVYHPALPLARPLVTAPLKRETPIVRVSQCGRA